MLQYAEYYSILNGQDRWTTLPIKKSTIRHKKKGCEIMNNKLSPLVKSLETVYESIAKKTDAPTATILSNKKNQKCYGSLDTIYSMGRC
jgi:SPX domain protein involved in polyphosphate accumulation